MTTNNQLNTATVPISVSEGGTSDSSLTAYAVICGGTSTTGAFQSIAALGTSDKFLTSNGAAALSTMQVAAGRLLSFQYLTTGTAQTYTPTTALVNNILVACLGAGGGGGGCTGGVANSGAAGGGASGGFCRKWIPNVGPSYTATYTVGAGGAGGTAGANAGTGGTATTFASGAVSLSAGGGGGGAGATAIASPLPNAVAGGSTATTTGGDFNSTGTPGYPGIFTINDSIGGAGGAAQFGGSANPLYETNGGATGNSGNNYGSGGGGASSYITNTSRAGGPGSAGLIIIWEYS